MVSSTFSNDLSTLRRSWLNLLLSRLCKVRPDFFKMRKASLGGFIPLGQYGGTPKMPLGRGMLVGCPLQKAMNGSRKASIAMREIAEFWSITQ